MRIRLLDEYGNLAPYAQLPVTLTLSGNAEIVDPSTVTLEGGSCGTYIRTTGDDGEAVLTISTPQTGSVSIKFNIKRREIKMKLTRSQTAAFGIGAVGKDMVYALSATYVMYFYQDILELSATFVGLILMIARVFDALNDPFMGILVAKTRSRWGRFRPWLFSGTVLNAVVLYALFSAPDLSESGMMVYFAVIYILWGTTYTMMDIPYRSMLL